MGEQKRGGSINHLLIKQHGYQRRKQFLLLEEVARRLTSFHLIGQARRPEIEHCYSIVKWKPRPQPKQFSMKGICSILVCSWHRSVVTGKHTIKISGHHQYKLEARQLEVS